MPGNSGIFLFRNFLFLLSSKTIHRGVDGKENMVDFLINM